MGGRREGDVGLTVDVERDGLLAAFGLVVVADEFTLIEEPPLIFNVSMATMTALFCSNSLIIN